MKTINKISILVLGLAALTATSCSDKAFDKYPTDSMQMETYVKNDTEALNILYDAYYYLRSISSSIITINGVGTDEAYNGKRNNGVDAIALNECTWDATFGISSSVWSNSYYMINRCNTVTDHDADLKDKSLVAEAKFLRAYAYFNLVRLFGPCPLTTSVIGNYQDLYNYSRESVDNIYQQIESDLAAAISGLPESRTAAAEQGRATKIAAWTLLGEVQMTRGNYSAAKTTLENVINYANANPSKLGLEEHVARIYDSTNPNGKEIIFAAQFNNGATVVANGFMSSCYINGGMPGTQPIYTFPDGTKFTITIGGGGGGLLMTWELWNKLRENPEDERLTKLVYSGTYDTQAVDTASDEVTVYTDPATGGTHANIPNTLKYFDFQNQGLSTCRSSCDNIIYRYGGVLLMYAECLNETGGDALKYINMIRTRAGIDEISVSGKDAVKQALEDESFRELCFEGHRWFDLLRNKRLKAVMTAHFNHRTPGLSPLHQGSDNGMVVADDKATSGTPSVWRYNDDVLFPIPYDQIQLTDWDQNPGY
ncbi:MAG: RagB/SusD family nutrient uptake outer membrane protein [Bacteroidales bacterium]|nr:RagB/SusD family nutrient uptake outer membrane protein [Bacteroidales bacterium]